MAEENKNKEENIQQKTTQQNRKSKMLLFVIIGVLALIGIGLAAASVIKVEKCIKWEEVCVTYTTTTHFSEPIKEVITVPAGTYITRSFNIPQNSNVYIYVYVTQGGNRDINFYISCPSFSDSRSRTGYFESTYNEAIGGTCTITLDNSFSWITSKIVEVYVKVTWSEKICASTAPVCAESKKISLLQQLLGE